ncbi:acyltransferase [Streptococcus rifensis]
MKEKTYHYGIDFLRIVAMFMIVVTHVLAQGGIRKEVEGSFDLHYFVTWLLQIAVYWAVNAYALISGYVGHRSRYRYSKIIELWLHVFFYTFLFAVGFTILGKELSLTDWRNALFPILTGKYWYVTAYFGLLVFMPLLNLALERLATKDLGRVLVIAFFSFSLIPALFNNKINEFALDRGYSSLWLIILYLTGAYLARKELNKLPRNSLLFLGYTASVLLSFILKKVVGNIWFWYTSPTMILGAICIFVIFARMEIKNITLQAFIKVLAPTTLGIYLVHLNPLVVRFLLRDFAKPLTQLPILPFLGAILAASVFIFVLSGVIDWLRLLLFQKVNIKRLSERCDQRFPYQSKETE